MRRFRVSDYQTLTVYWVDFAHKFGSRDTPLVQHLLGQTFPVNFYEVAISFEMKIIHILLLSLLLCSGLTDAIEPISTSIAVGMAAALTGFLASYQNIFYYFHECCKPEWIHFNRTGKQQTSLNVIFVYRISLTCH